MKLHNNLPVCHTSLSVSLTHRRRYTWRCRQLETRKIVRQIQLTQILFLVHALCESGNMLAELQRAKGASESPLVRKIGNPSSRENLVMTSPYERPSSVQTLGEGEGCLNVTCDFGCSQLIRFIYLLRSLSHPN
mgnify:CR=1 FL=1